MAESAIGLIETRGLVGVIEAADTAAKSADVQLLGIEQVGGGLVSVHFCGEVAAVRAAVQAASRAAEQVAELISAHVISRPCTGMGQLMGRGPTGAGPVAAAAPAPEQPPAVEPGARGAASEVELASLSDSELARLSVSRLRQLARRTPGLSLQGRQISRANKRQLLEALAQVRHRGDTA